MVNRIVRKLLVRPEYTAEKINDLYERGQKAIAAGSAPEDPWLHVAAAHALDLYELAKDRGTSLDFTIETQEDLDISVVTSAAQLSLQGKNPVEAKNTTAKRLAGYMLFQLYNDLAALDYSPWFECKRESYGIAAETNEGKVLRIDLLAEAKRGVRNFKIGTPQNGMIGGGTLQPFHQAVYEDFMRPLLESAE